MPLASDVDSVFPFARGVFKIDWDTVPPATIVERMVEFAYGALLNKQNRVCFVNFILNVTPGCDCLPFSDACIVPDVGIAASLDPVALDQACVDLVNGQQGIPSTALDHGLEPHEDKFSALYPQVNWQQQLVYAEQIGIGVRDYELLKIG